MRDVPPVGEVFRDTDPSSSRSVSEHPNSNRTEMDPESNSGGKILTREMVLSCVSRAGSKRALNEKLDAYLARLTHVPLDGKDISGKLEVVATVCPGVRVLYLYDNRIIDMQGLQKTKHLTHLHLQNNRIREISGLGSCSTLEKLYLDGNQLTKIDGLSGCVRLKALHVSNQKPRDDDDEDDDESGSKSSSRLTLDPPSFAALAGSLTRLDVSRNDLYGQTVWATSMSLLSKLENLDVSNCGIGSVDDLKLLLAKCGRLANLSCGGNPFELTDKKNREKITVAGESLTAVNGKEITHKERVFLTRLDRRRCTSGVGRGSARLVTGQTHHTQESPGVNTRLDRTFSSNKLNEQHLATIANLGEGTVDHGFEPAPGGGGRGDRVTHHLTEPMSPGGDLKNSTSPGELTIPPGSPGATSQNGWRESSFPSPPEKNAANSPSPRNFGGLVSPLHGTLDGTGTFHDGMTLHMSQMNVGGAGSLVSPKGVPKKQSSGGRGGRGGVSHKNSAASPSRNPVGAIGEAALDGVGGTAYVPPKRVSRTSPPAPQETVNNTEPDVTSRFEVPDE